MTSTTKRSNVLDLCLPLALDFEKFYANVGLADSQYQVDAEDQRRTHARKTLLYDCDQLWAIHAHDNETRNWMRRKTVYSHYRPGIYLIPMSLLTDVETYLAGRKAERDRLVAAFVGVYRIAIERDRVALKTLFDEGNYPPVETLPSHFDMRWNYLEIGPSQKLANVNRAIYEKAVERAERHMEQFTRQIDAVLVASVNEMVGDLHARLTERTPKGNRKRITSRGVEILQEFINDFPTRNLTQNKSLAAIVRRLQPIVNRLDPATLEAIANEDTADAARAAIAPTVAAVKDALASIVTDAPSRRVILRKAS